MARRLVPTFAVLVALVLVAQPALGQQPKRGGVLRIADREAPNLDPHLAVSFLTHSWSNMVYSQLVRYPHGPEQKHPADFSIVPDLAAKWEHKCPTVIEFTLKKGVKFHNKPPVNGREVTAEDAKYSIERFMAKSGFRARFDVVQSVDVVDRHTLRVTLKEPFAPFLNHLAASTYVAILPREDVAREECDLVELNHFYDEHGRSVFDQVIFYDWSESEARHQVRAWRLVKHPAQIPQRCWQNGGGWVVCWYDGELLRYIRAAAFRETWTQHDPELEERAWLPKERRRELRRVLVPE